MEKYPKQLKHWIKKAGLKQFGTKQISKTKRNTAHNFSFATFEGHGFFWCFTINGEIYRSSVVENFEDWNNSLAFTLPIPDSEKLFLNYINHLRKSVHHNLDS